MAKTDGRKRRWHQHKVERRTELVDGALDAIRRLGRDVGMDEIAAEIGVSKTVLYRYFVDKNDLTTAVLMRFTQTTLIPNLAAALASGLDGFAQTREIIRVYVDTVAAEPEPYRFRDGEQFGQQEQGGRRLRNGSSRACSPSCCATGCKQVGMDTGGVEPWADMIVGGVQLATHSWMSNPRMTSAELIDYLTMLCWNALCGIVGWAVPGGLQLPAAPVATSAGINPARAGIVVSTLLRYG